MMKIGIDIGGMSVKYGLVNDKNEIIARHVIKTNTEIPAAEFVKEMCNAVHTLMDIAKQPLELVTAIGMGAPGIVDGHNGTIVYSANFGWKNVNIIELFKQEFNLPMGLANDADAAALGEVCEGAAKGKDNVILLTLGTGVGGGVILDKKILSGPLKGGCEVGHITLDMNGNTCACGQKGCYETYASATALMRIGKEAVNHNPESMLAQKAAGDMDAVDGKLIFDCAQAGDHAALQVVEEYLHGLSAGIATLVNIFRPEVIILGGGVAAQKEKLTSAVQRKVETLSFGPGVSEVPVIVTSKLGNDAGIIGAANLV